VPAVLAALLLTSPAAAQFSAQPVIVELNAGPGGTTSTFAVRNESDEPVQLRIYAGDYDQTETGEYQFMDAGDHPRSCASRLRIYPDNLTLPARGTGEVRLTMEPGAATCWSLVFAESVSRSPAGIRIAQRIGVRVYGVGPQVRREGEIVEVRTELDGAGGRVVQVGFSNTGSGPVRPEGELEVRSASGTVVGVVPIAPFTVLPERISIVRVPLDLVLDAGTYVLVPILDFGGEYLAGGQGMLEVEAN
jgi:hypothetical protein